MKAKCPVRYGLKHLNIEKSLFSLFEIFFRDEKFT